MKASIICLMVILLVGCGSSWVVYTPHTEGRFSPSPLGKVEMFMTAPRRDYTEIGALRIRGRARWSTDQELFALFRRRSAQIGADGFIILAMGFQPSGGSIINTGGGNRVFVQHTRRVMSAVAIRWK